MRLEIDPVKRTMALSSSLSSATSNFIISAVIFFLLIGRSQCDEDYNRIESQREILGSRPGGVVSGEISNVEKRSWQNLQGSWGKRDAPPNDEDDDYEMSVLNGATDSESGDYDGSLNIQKLANCLRQHGSQQLHPPLETPSSNQQHYSNSEQKRAWKSMGGAWGKRLGSGDWNKFRGSWGKREPGWNNLKGLWGKRAPTANNWNKLQSAWGKRDSY